jgi:SAM-dependent methyltransferase
LTAPVGTWDLRAWSRAYARSVSPTDPDYVTTNREAWTAVNAAYTDGRAGASWAEPAITWGVFGVPESTVRALPDLRGRDIVELGCGTGYFGARLKRAGANRVVGVDVTPAQLETARRCEVEFGLGLEFVEANAEATSLPDGAFDLAVSEYGASIWCDPERWLPEAARLLRPDGELVFLRNSTLSMLCTPDEGKVTTQLQRDQRTLCRLDWGDDDPGVEFHLPAGELVRLLRRTGFELLDLVELYAPEDATDHPYYDHVPLAWATQWPVEEVWRARLAPPSTHRVGRGGE